MPKAFSEREKETIRVQMLEKGRKLFEKQGIKKTSVEELAQAAGISKGAFYLFYESKEELLMEILEGLETDFQKRIFDFSISPKSNARELLAKLFKDTLLMWDEYPLLKNIGRDEYEYLARKLPPEQKENVRRNFERWRQLPPEQRERLRERWQRWRELPPERRDALRRQFQRFQELPPEQRRELREKFQERLRSLPPEKRQELREKLRERSKERREKQKAER